MKRILIFTGKGGVGKTCVAAAHALNSSQEGKKTLFQRVVSHPGAKLSHAARRPTATGNCRPAAPTPRAACYRPRASIRIGFIRFRARPTPNRCILTIRPWPETGGSPSSCCARRRSCPRIMVCNEAFASLTHGTLRPSFP